MNVVLASASPRRASLLRQIRLDFSVDVSSVDEESITGHQPGELVRILAALKGKDIAPKQADSLIIAADTVVCMGNKILGKPGSAEEAFRMLKKLSGKTHEVYTGVYIARTDRQCCITDDFTFYERTKVTFSSLEDQEIEHYIATGSPFDKAGGYGIQDDMGSLFVKKIDGDYYNVVGFPLQKFYRQMKENMPGIHQILFF